MEKEDLFYLNKDVVFFNHGSFGACPLPVMEEFQKWQKTIESRPMEYIGRKHASLMKASREILGKYIGSDPNNLVFVSNATHAMSMVAWSLDLKPGNEVLTSNLEYGAMDRMWEIVCRSGGAKYIKAVVDLPVKSNEDFFKMFSLMINKNTKVLFLSLITSTTALYFNLDEICRFAKSKGIITVVDGAHAPGQIPLQLDESNFDFFTGNCHKWLFAPKGVAFLYAKAKVQNLLNPLIVSWGKEIDTIGNSDFINDFEYLGTRDISAFLSISASIAFHDKYLTSESKMHLNDLLNFAKAGMQNILKTSSIVGDEHFKLQMYAHELPADIDGIILKRKLYDEFKIEIPVSKQNGREFIRISVQIYNTKAEIEYFLEKLKYLIGSDTCKINQISSL